MPYLKYTYYHTTYYYHIVTNIMPITNKNTLCPGNTYYVKKRRNSKQSVKESTTGFIYFFS